jgi:plasmid maintenance system antidote protein VapI
MKKVHIGKIIQEKVKAKGLEVTEFASLLGYTRDNAYKIFKEQEINTNTLCKVSEVLEENLHFYFISDTDLAKYWVNKMNPVEVAKAVLNSKEDKK